MKKLIKIALLTLPLTALAGDTVPTGMFASPTTNDVVLTKDNTITLSTDFNGESVAKLTIQARELDSRVNSSDPLYLVLNSPGGSIDAGLELIENLSNLRRPVITINLFAASMGFQTAQGLGTRLITANGTLMSHKARGEFAGEFPGQLDSRYSYYLKRVVRMNEKAVERSKGKHTLDSYNSLIENEYWCDGQDCVDQGFADKVVKPSCDKSLSGTKKSTIGKFMFMGMAVSVDAELDNCPLNTNALGYDIAVNGEVLFKEKTLFDRLVAPVSKVQELNSETLFEIQKRANEIITRVKNKQVIKGY